MKQVSFIDAHVHTGSRSIEDFERLAVVGCTGVVAVAGAEGGFRGPDSVLDHFRQIANVDRRRVQRSGMRCYLALGIHPAGIPEHDVDSLLAALPEALREHGANAVGEIGLAGAGEVEERVLAREFGIAAELGLGAIVHTPRKGKAAVVERTLEILARSPLLPGRVLLDHLDSAALEVAEGVGCFLGLSVHPAKLSPEAAADIVGGHGPERLVLSTDMGMNPSYLFGIPAVVSAMRDRGVSEETIRAVVHDNAARFLDPGT